MKVAIYCRLSEEDKNKRSEAEDSESIQNQKSMLIQYAMEKQWEIYGIYSDDDYTGADRNRPQFNQLIRDAEERKFNIVLCKTQSRFTRELELVEKYIHGLFPSWNVRFISLVDNADTDNKGNKKSRQINGLINEWYLEDLSENIKSVLVNKRKKGAHIGSFSLYGYKKDPTIKGHLLIDEEAAAIVREVFSLFAKGYGKTAIARILNDRGIPNPSEYKRMKGLRYQQPKSKNSTLWKYFSIAHMLVNEIYIGNMVQGKYGSVSYKSKQNKPRPKAQWYIVEGTHEPIIDLTLWEQVQALIGQRTKPFSNGAIGLFAKKARCMNCGYTMRSHKSRGKHYLKCSTHHLDKTRCCGAFVSVEKLEKALLKEINRLSMAYLDRDELERKLQFSRADGKISWIKAELKACQKKVEDYTKAIQDLYLDKSKGIISQKEYLDFSKEFSQSKALAESRIANLTTELQTLESQAENLNDKQRLIEQYIDLKALDRIMIEKLVEYITIGKREKGTKEIVAEIHWNF